MPKKCRVPLLNLAKHHNVKEIVGWVGLRDLQLAVEVMSEKKDNQNNEDNEPFGPDTGVVEKIEARTKRPDMYKVLLLNDDYTPMEFVVQLLRQIFHLSEQQSVRIMLSVHQDGVGVCGVYSFEVAETKVAQVISASRTSEHPLQCTMEKA